MIKKIEKQLEGLIKKYKLEKKLSVGKIKKIVYNAKGARDIIETIKFFGPKVSDLDELNSLTAVFMAAWNYFPHKDLGGMSPNEKAEQFKKGKGTPAPKSSFTPLEKMSPLTIRPHGPTEVGFVRIGKNEWGFEFPREYFEYFDKLDELETSDVSAGQYEKKLQSFIRKMPELFDAARLLAEFYTFNGQLKLAGEIFQSSTGMARTYFPENFKAGRDRIPWAWVDNRPFLRLFLSHAMFVERHQKASKARPLYEEILLLNPGDNQGVRSLLSTLYFKLGLAEEVLALGKKYPKDLSPEIIMGRILAFIKLGKEKEALARIKKDKRWIKHLVIELLKASHVKPENCRPDRVTLGGEDEAYYYWEDQGAFWQATRGAIEFLKKNFR